MPLERVIEEHISSSIQIESNSTALSVHYLVKCSG